MISKDYMKKLLALNAKLKAVHDITKDNYAVHVLARSAKVAEEYGELIDEILGSLGLQRQDKLDKLDKENLKKEYGDLVLTVFLLGLSLDLDIKQVISDRLEEKYQEHGED